MDVRLPARSPFVSKVEVVGGVLADPSEVLVLDGDGALPVLVVAVELEARGAVRRFALCACGAHCVAYDRPHGVGVVLGEIREVARAVFAENYYFT